MFLERTSRQELSIRFAGTQGNSFFSKLTLISLSVAAICPPDHWHNLMLSLLHPVFVLGTSPDVDGLGLIDTLISTVDPVVKLLIVRIRLRVARKV